MEQFLQHLVPPDKLIHMTVTYSNAVLMLVMTNVSDFAKKLNLPIPQPVTAAQVQKFSVYPVKGMIGGVLTLTNGDRFFYEQGYLNTFNARDYNSFPDEMDPVERHKLWVEKFRGRMNMTTNEVIEFARESLRNLGYDLQSIGADGPPDEFSGPWKPDDHPNYIIPLCSLAWHDKKTSNTVRIEINADKKRLTHLFLAGPYFRRP